MDQKTKLEEAFFCKFPQKQFIWEKKQTFEGHNNPPSYLRKRVGEVALTQRILILMYESAWQSVTKVLKLPFFGLAQSAFLQHNYPSILYKNNTSEA